MAKKRRQKTEKKEESDFKLPEFDEHEYIALELRKSKLAFVAFLYAFIMVIITYLLYTVTHPDWRGPIVLGLLAVAGLPFIVNLIKLDITDFDWKNWFGGGAIYIFSWLAFFILVVNPPFSDFADPEIEINDFYYLGSNDDTTTWKEINITKDTEIPMFSPTKIKVRAKITDNSEIDKDSVKITIRPSIINNATKITIRLKHVDGNNFETIMVPENSTSGFQTGNFKFIIEAKDVNGHTSTKSGDFQISKV